MISLVLRLARILLRELVLFESACFHSKLGCVKLLGRALALTLLCGLLLLLSSSRIVLLSRTLRLSINLIFNPCILLDLRSRFESRFALLAGIRASIISLGLLIILLFLPALILSSTLRCILRCLTHLSLLRTTSTELFVEEFLLSLCCGHLGLRLFSRLLSHVSGCNAVNSNILQ